jgi:hypothetical protein
MRMVKEFNISRSPFQNALLFSGGLDFGRFPVEMVDSLVLNVPERNLILGSAQWRLLVTKTINMDNIQIWSTIEEY